MYVYKQSETAQQTGSFPLFTVGYYDPSDNEFVPESDWGGETGREDAANRVAALNGNQLSGRVLARIESLEHEVKTLRDQLAVESIEPARSLIVGKRYRVKYKLPDQRKMRTFVADLIGCQSDAFIFSGRPKFGTVPLDPRHIMSYEETQEEIAS